MSPFAFSKIARLGEAMAKALAYTSRPCKVCNCSTPHKVVHGEGCKAYICLPCTRQRRQEDNERSTSVLRQLPQADS